jgi:hypothetical protein
MKLASMKLDKKEQKKETEIAYDAPDYPWGLCVELNDDALDKLKLEELPDVGDEMQLIAKVTVTTVSENASRAGASRRVSLQITEMAIGPEQADGDPSGKLYT